MRFANTRINGSQFISDGSHGAINEFNNAQMPPIQSAGTKRNTAANRNRDSLMAAALGPGAAKQSSGTTELRVSDKLL